MFRNKDERYKVSVAMTMVYLMDEKTTSQMKKDFDKIVEKAIKEGKERPRYWEFVLDHVHPVYDNKKED